MLSISKFCCSVGTRKQTSRIPQGTSNFRRTGVWHCICINLLTTVQKRVLCGLHVFTNNICRSRRWRNNLTLLYTVNIGLINEIGHTSNKGCLYTKIFWLHIYTFACLCLSKTLAAVKQKRCSYGLKFSSCLELLAVRTNWVCLCHRTAWRRCICRQKLVTLRSCAVCCCLVLQLIFQTGSVDRVFHSRSVSCNVTWLCATLESRCKLLLWHPKMSSVICIFLHFRPQTFLHQMHFLFIVLGSKQLFRHVMTCHTERTSPPYLQ